MYAVLCACNICCSFLLIEQGVKDIVEREELKFDKQASYFDVINNSLSKLLRYAMTYAIVLFKKPRARFSYISFIFLCLFWPHLSAKNSLIVA